MKPSGTDIINMDEIIRKLLLSSAEKPLVQLCACDKRDEQVGPCPEEKIISANEPRDSISSTARTYRKIWRT
jgi:hypothetical protein